MMTLDLFPVVGMLLLIAYAATIVGAAMDKTKRSRVREIVDAFALPITMLCSKPPRVPIEENVPRRRDLSGLRVLAFGIFAVVSAFIDAPLSDIEVWGLVAPAGLLVLDTMLAHVPAREFLAWLTSLFGSGVVRRAKAREVSVETSTEGTSVEIKADEPAADGALG